VSRCVTSCLLLPLLLLVLVLVLGGGGAVVQLPFVAAVVSHHLHVPLQSLGSCLCGLQVRGLSEEVVSQSRTIDLLRRQCALLEAQSQERLGHIRVVESDVAVRWCCLRSSTHFPSPFPACFSDHTTGWYCGMYSQASRSHASSLEAEVASLKQLLQETRYVCAWRHVCVRLCCVMGGCISPESSRAVCAAAMVLTRRWWTISVPWQPCKLL
jgi:hypothetical protein